MSVLPCIWVFSFPHLRGLWVPLVGCLLVLAVCPYKICPLYPLVFPALVGPGSARVLGPTCGPTANVEEPLPPPLRPS